MPKSKNRIKKFFQDFKRRKVGQVLIAYAGVAAIIIGIAEPIENDLNFPEPTSTIVLIILIVGLPIAGILTWVLKRKVKDQTESELSPSGIKEKSIIVLPFENISSDPEQEYFSDGLTEEIITDLSHIQDLLVISRGSAMTFKGTNKKIKEIASEVNVRYVLEGSVRKSGNNLRIVAQLIDAENDSHMWAEKFDGVLDDIFDIQEKVSRSIVNELKLKLSAREDKKISEHLIKDITAYEYYLKAKQEIYRFSEKGLDRALQLIDNGLQIIGDNELLYSSKGLAYYLYIDAGIKPRDLCLPKIEECVRKIFILNPDSAYYYFLKGVTNLNKRKMQEAVKDLKTALSITPDNPDSILQLIRIYCSVGKRDSANKLLAKGLLIDPFNPLIYSLPGYIQLLDGDFDLATESYKKMYQMEPDSPVYTWFYAMSLIYARRNGEAFELIDQLRNDFAGSVFSDFGIFLKSAIQGKNQAALKVITPELKEFAKEIEYYSREMANGYALLNEKDLALDWLDNTINCGFINYPFLAEINPLLENIRGEKRFKILMERVKTEWENFEV